jgi:tetratricopeptide (TPR) repeat protein
MAVPPLRKLSQQLSEAKIVKLSTGKVILAILILGLVVFGNGLFNGFIQDDGPQIVDNPAVHSLTNTLNFFKGSTFYNGGTLTGQYYRPMQSLFYAILYFWAGANPFLYHLVQLLLHITNAILVFYILKHYFKKELTFGLSLIFLVHPINSETVFYIANLQDVLALLFGLLAILILINYKKPKDLFVIGLFLLLSLLSKETGIVIAGIIILYAVLFNRKKAIQISAISLGVTFFYLILRLTTVGFTASPQSSPINSLSLAERMLNAPSIMFFYLKTFVYPMDLASSYSWVIRTPNFENFWLPGILDILFLGVCGSYLFLLFKTKSRNFKIFLLFLGWFLLGIILHLQILPLDMTVAEHWFYFPIVGLLGMLGVVLNQIKVNHSIQIGLAILCLLILTFSMRDIIRGFDWRDNLTLATHDIQDSNGSYDLENTIAFELLKQGKLDGAKIHAQKSVEIYPYITNLNTLGLIYLNQGDYANSKLAYTRALKYGKYYMIYENLGGLAMVYGDPQENISFLKSAVTQFPYDSKLWLYLAILEYKSNQPIDAKLAIQKAYNLDKSSDNRYFYNKINNNEPLNINFNSSPL